MSRVDVRIDEVDLQIIKILIHNCRTSYRKIAKTLGISANTARTRINNLILNKTIEKFVTFVNFSLFGYNSILTILLKVNKNHQNVIDKIAKSMMEWEPIYMHIEIFDEVHVFGIAVNNIHVNNNNIDYLKKKISKSLGNGISVHDVFFWQTYIISIRKISLT